MPTFHLFRYQILPSSRHFQESIYDGKTINDILASKNAIFWAILKSIDPFVTSRAKNVTQILAESEDLLVLRTGVARKLLRSTEDFKSEQLDNWPSAAVIVWNDEEKQILAIEHNPNAFNSPSVLARRLQKNIDKHLAPYQLNLHIKTLFDQRLFWDLIKKHEGGIEILEFNYLTPNMASISKALTDTLKNVAKESNSVRNTLQLKAEKNSSLVISEENAQLNGLLDYTSKGGGDVKIKLRGLRKKVTVGHENKEVEVGELDFEGPLAPESIEVLKNILDV